MIGIYHPDQLNESTLILGAAGIILLNSCEQTVYVSHSVFPFPKSGTPGLLGKHAYAILLQWLIHTVMIPSFQTNRSGQIVQTKIRLLLEEQSDQGFHCLLLYLHLFDEIP